MRHVSKETARSYILGYTCVNDVTARDLQSKDGLETLKAILRSYREEQRAMKWDLRDFPF